MAVEGVGNLDCSNEVLAAVDEELEFWLFRLGQPVPLPAMLFCCCFTWEEVIAMLFFSERHWM